MMDRYMRQFLFLSAGCFLGAYIVLSWGLR